MGPFYNGSVQTLLVAGAGGHLEELWMLRPRLVGISDRVTWVTSDTPQSRALLGDDDRVFIPKSRPHDVGATLVSTRRALSVVRPDTFDQVVSTGAARVDGPSLSARLLERVPGVHRYGQYEWNRPNWSYRGSVFDGFAPSSNPAGRAQRIVVTVGVSGLPFGRLIEAVLRAAPQDAEILFQTGTTEVGDLDIAAQPTMATEDLLAAMRAADVVVAHGGVGSAIMAMQAGKCPVLVPRERAHREHVDDHQREVASSLARAGLALMCDPPSLDGDLLAEAARRRVVSNRYASPFVLSTN